MIASIAMQNILLYFCDVKMGCWFIDLDQSLKIDYSYNFSATIIMHIIIIMFLLQYSFSLLVITKQSVM